jgi:hypothetical protein
MQKNCAYCGNLFSFQRNTRKYCSDNCKQMAYFSRNGFIPVNESHANAIISGLQNNATSTATVKDVKYSKRNGFKGDEIGTYKESKEDQRERIMECSKCLIRNLLNLSDHERIERGTFMELAATWSQFVRWYAKQNSTVDFQHDLMAELDQKLCVLAKAHRQSDFIEVMLSERLKDQLEDSLTEMAHIQNIKFVDIRF